ncbi:MAG TPA: MauE/DoxX family redox-associated membrane protein [Flavobacteriaceae bacterium]|nr:MauE/DoxX family redox-associated membrane protein [Flavobacteriaceae bacterium]
MRVLLKNRFVLITTYFLAVLFIYTGVSKLLDMGIFQSQIAQSAMLAPYASILAWLVPVVELLLAGLLLISSTRVWGLLGSAVLMLGFTIYVYLIWTYSPSLPCSCGGVLEAMDWETHLYFNLATTLLAGTAWYIDSNQTKNYTVLVTSSVGIIGLVLLLFYTQPQPSILQDESFTRIYKEKALEEKASQKLAYNSYYVAGVNDSLVYLGNSTGFTHGLVWNYHTNDTIHISLQLPDAPDNFASLPKWQVHGKYFYIGEGVSPSLYRGKTSDWTAREFMPAVPYYSDIVVLDSTEFIIRALHASTQKYVLATYKDIEPYVQIHDVLEQEDGNLFQADGSLHWDYHNQSASYLYYYKNKIANWTNGFKEPGQTNLIYSIDASAVSTHQGRDGTHLRDSPVSALHSNIRIWKNQSYVLSNVMGAGENPNDFSANAVIDVYADEYTHSLRIPNRNGEKARTFYINDHHIIALYPTQVVVYEHTDLLMAMSEQE